MPDEIRSAVPFARPSQPRQSFAVTVESLQKTYADLAAQSAEADAAGNAGEVGRIKPLKIAAFKAWKDAEKPAELKAKEAARLRKV